MRFCTSSVAKFLFHFLVVVGNTAGIFIDPDLLKMTTTLAVAGCIFTEGFRNRISKPHFQVGINLYKSYVIVSQIQFLNELHKKLNPCA